MADNFSVSRDGVQMPYRRFLADSAAGLSLMLLAVASYYLPVVSDEPLRERWLRYLTRVNQHGIGTEVKVFVLLVLFLLATPIGFAVNALSWLLIDYPISAFERLYFRWSRRDGRIFPLWDVTQARFATTLDDFFGLTESNFNLAGWFFRDVLEAYVPERFETQTHIKGLVVFLRNLTLYAVALAFVSLAMAVGFSVWLSAVVAAALASITLLVSRWGADNRSDVKRRRRSNLAVVAVMVAALALAFFGATDSHWAVRAVILIVVATLTTAVIGMVEYYYHDAILLHAYFACYEHDVIAPTTLAEGENRIMAIACMLIRKVGEKSRVRETKTTEKHAG